MPKFVNSPHYSSSGFLTYWYDNNLSAGNLTGILSKNAADLIQPMLDKFMAKQDALKQSLTSASPIDGSAQKILELFDLSVYNQDQVRSILEPNVSKNNEDTGVSLDSLQTALEQLSKATAEVNNLTVKMEEFVKGIEEIMNAIDPSGRYKGVITKIKKALLGKYCEQAQARGKVDITTATSETGILNTITGQEILRDILERTDNDAIFDDLAIRNKKVNGLDVDKALKKIMMLAIALPAFADGNTGLVGISAQHGDGSSSSASKSENDVINLLIEKTRGLVIVLKGKTGETAKAYAAVKAHIADGGYNTFEKGLKVKAFKSGSKTFGVECIPEDSGNQTFLNVLKEADVALGRLKNQVSKADVGIQINNNGVTGSVGFSVKVGKKLNDDTYLGAATIHIQSGTSLAVLLGREMGLNSAQYYSVMQLLAGHGTPYGPNNDADLNATWEILKEKLLYMAFIDALTGVSLGGKAYFMIVGNYMYSMQQIIQEMQKGSNGNLSLSAGYAQNNAGSLDRDAYLALNTWRPPENPDTPTGYERGQDVFQQVSSLLYKTKVRISMNISSMSQFRAMIGR